MFLGLKSPGIKVFMVIYQLLLDDPNYQQDKIDLTYSLLPKDVQDSISRTTYTRGVKELRNVFLAPTMHDGVYWINIDYVFKGDRLTLVNQYILDGATEVDPKTYDAITSQTHEDAPEGASEQSRYRNTSDLSNGVQRANVSGNVPQQNLKRREAAFCWARRVRTREMQKCASPFVEVRQIEFLVRETPNYIATTCTHPINGHARA